MPLTLAILGRPNVGKSTLFNRLAGKRLALVDDRPGVTRDWREAPGRIADLDLRLLDTAGLEEVFDDSLEARMRRQTEAAIDQADVLLLLIDGRAGVTPLDEHFAAWVRRRGQPVILGVNKCEGRAAQPGLLDAYGLGLGDPVPLSAEHGEGLSALYDALAPHATQGPAVSDAEAADEEAGGPLKLAVVGRPNVGKSTLVNALLGAERMLTGPEAGITRDAIAVDWCYRDHAIRLVDTAGLRRRAKVIDRVESMSGGETKRAIDLAQCVVLVLDGNAILERQDLTIGQMVEREGRALVIAINKWDAVADKQTALTTLKHRLQHSLPQLKGVPTVTISALNRLRLDALMDLVLTTTETWSMRVPTGPLNRWLADMVAQNPPPMIRGRRLKLRYMTQIKSRPPTFALFSSRKDVPAAYQRYLINGLREDFGLGGVPLRLYVRTGENPYAPKT